MGQIYERSVKEIMIEYFNKLSLDDEFSTQEMIKYFRDNYPLIKEGAIIAHLILFSTNAKSRVNHNSHKNKKCDLLFKLDKNRYRLYDKKNDPSPIYEGEIIIDDEPTIDEDGESNQKFTYERDYGKSTPPCSGLRPL